MSRSPFASWDSSVDWIPACTCSISPGCSGLGIEQAYAELILELPQRLADRLLRSAEVLRGTREPTLIEDGQKVAKLLELHPASITVPNQAM